MLGFYDCPSVSTWSYSGGYGQNASIAICKTRRVSWAPCFVPHNATYDIEDVMRTARVRAVIMVV